MAEARIPADLFNPGQVFACLGLVEAADILLGDAEGAFDWESATETTFILRATGDEDPLEVVLDFLLRAEVKSLAPPDSANRTENWDGIPTKLLNAHQPFPAADPSSPATLPALLFTGAGSVVVDYWIDGERVSGRDNAKFWAGSSGKPGVSFLQDALALMRQEPQRLKGESFDYDVAQSSSFRFDWRRDYVPLDTGFSLNQHKDKIFAVGYPLVEVLAAIGLSHARPLRLQDKLHYRYAVPGLPQLPGGATPLYPPIFLRAALGCAELPFPMRTFRMNLDWPGQAGQARAITHIYEETTP